MIWRIFELKELDGTQVRRRQKNERRAISRTRNAGLTRNGPAT